jgi:hypothetical protein
MKRREHPEAHGVENAPAVEDMSPNLASQKRARTGSKTAFQNLQNVPLEFLQEVPTVCFNSGNYQAVKVPKATMRSKQREKQKSKLVRQSSREISQRIIRQSSREQQQQTQQPQQQPQQQEHQQTQQHTQQHQQVQPPAQGAVDASGLDPGVINPELLQRLIGELGPQHMDKFVKVCSDFQQEHAGAMDTKPSPSAGDPSARDAPAQKTKRGGVKTHGARGVGLKMRRNDKQNKQKEQRLGAQMRHRTVAAAPTAPTVPDGDQIGAGIPNMESTQAAASAVAEAAAAERSAAAAAEAAAEVGLSFQKRAAPNPSVNLV